MGAQAILITCIVALHLLGIILFFVNVLYLKCTRGFDRAKKVRNASNEELANLKRMRCCKLRSIKAANILSMYHVMLVLFDFTFVFVYQSLPASSKVLDSPETILWLLPGMSYMIIFVSMPIFAVLGISTRAHIGPIQPLNMFEFFHFVIFWASLLFMIICSAVGRGDLPEDLKNYAGGYGAIPMAWCYLMMLIGVWLHKSFLKLEVISKLQAVTLINGKIEETPAIEWTISCGYTTQSRHSSHYHELHRETKTYTYDSNNIRRTVKPDVPSEDMFQRRVTELTVFADIKPGDLWTLNNMERTREQFRQKHKGHDDELNLTEKHSSEDTYLVRRDENDSTSEVLQNKTRYWIFALLGLSLPYRWYLYYSLGHVKYIIRRKVFSQGAQGATDASFTEEQGSLVQAYGSNIQYSPGYEEESVKLGPSGQSTPPPDYKVCITGDEKSRDYPSWKQHDHPSWNTGSSI